MPSHPARVFKRLEDRMQVRKVRSSVRILTLLILMALPDWSVDQGPLPAECASTLCRLVSGGQLTELRWPDFSDCKPRVKDFYESSGYALAWVQGGAATGQA